MLWEFLVGHIGVCALLLDSCMSLPGLDIEER